MNSILYLHRDLDVKLWYKTRKNSRENSGATLCPKIAGFEYRLYEWTNLDLTLHRPIGSSCLVQW